MNEKPQQSKKKSDPYIIYIGGKKTEPNEWRTKKSQKEHRWALLRVEIKVYIHQWIFEIEYPSMDTQSRGALGVCSSAI